MTTIPLAPLSLEPEANHPARKENKVRPVIGNSASIPSLLHAWPYILHHQFVAFFRSRSRSRSRKPTPNSSAAQSTTELPILPPLPVSKPRISHARSTSLANEPGHTSNAHIVPAVTQQTPKPATRISSRPISSTTTATHSTITPLPSDSIRRRHRLTRNIYSHDLQGDDPDHQANTDPATSHDDHDSAPRSGTPSSFHQRRRLELLSIFGIGLSRKTSNSSRKPSPASSSRKVSSSALSLKEAESKPSHKRSFKLNSRSSSPKFSNEPRMKTSTSTLPTPSSPLPLSASPRRLSFGLTSSSHVHSSMTSSGHLPLGHSSHYGKRHSIGSHDTAHDSAVALPDDHSDSAASSSNLDTKSSANMDSKLTRTGKSRKGKEQEHDSLSWSPTCKTSHTDNSRYGGFRSLPEETSLIVNISPPPPLNEPHVKYDPGGLPVTVLPTVESRSSSEDIAEPLPAVRASHAKSVIPQIIHTPPTPQRAEEIPPVRPATTPPRLSGGKGKPREVVLSQETVIVHNELPRLHAHPPPHPEDAVHRARIRNRFSPRLFGSKDFSREKETKKQKPGGSYDSTHPAASAGQPRNMTHYRIKHGSFDFERPVSSLNRSNSTVNTSLAKDRTASSSSDRTGKPRTYAYHPARADSPILAQLSPNHTGETSVVSFSSQSAQSKSTGKHSTPAPGQSSSWGRSSGRRAQRTSHGPFPFEPAASAPNSPLPNSLVLPLYSPKLSPHRVEFEVPEEPSSLPTSSPLRSEFGHEGGSIRDKSQSARSRGQQEREQRVEKKGKGRSLDLNLGLSWAPSRVRQEAVIPGLLLSQTISQKQEEERRGKDVTKIFESVLSESSFEAFKKYVRRFDAHLIPLEGPRGLLARVENLLTPSPISQTEKAELLDQFARFVKGHNEI